MPRTDAPLTLPEPANSGLHCDGETLEFANGTPALTKPASTNALFDSSREGFLHIALRRDLQVSAPQEKEQKVKTYQNIATHNDAKQYLDAVQQRVKQVY